TQDHLDFHGSMGAYEEAKLRLFTELPKQTSKKFVGAINGDDGASSRWASAVPTSLVLYHQQRSELDDSLEVTNPLSAKPLHSCQLVFGYAEPIEVDHIVLTLMSPSVAAGNAKGMRIPLGGSYNVENCIAAASGMIALGYTLDDVGNAFEGVRPVPGRFEAVPNDQGISVLVDYAHTPDALEKLLDAVRPLTKGRIITVFGCGGDRDRTKRPKMAKAASERSDVTVVTSDNPRTENPQSILDEVLTGVVSGGESVDIIDRKEAIAYAIKIAEPGDVVVIAGKGHENYQIIGRTKYPMDDRQMASQALEARS
ncbi:MAG: UDP-N-acetylmuramoyl-L-alanyl-D-glutamate--2,6-diaminopimelate ligase, partial [Fimbriimonadaceae bacterium]|nr:UDP-N-acetylmuramoyl-L-alanyl-D-glutamate--2,6-diaminopimelate ligase [Fimbriimonadaceae bacterium]